MSARLANDCFLHDRDRLRHDEALAIIAERITPQVGTERVTLENAAGRTLAEDIVAPRDVPSNTNAAVDGFAYRHRDAGEGALPIAARIPAGRVPEPLRPGTSARIFTGAILPEGADTVAMQEDCTRDGDGVRVPAIAQGANVRSAGEDFAGGSLVCRRGTALLAPQMAAIAATGHDRVLVRKPLRVALISTGDELLGPGTAHRPGGVYDANGPMLHAAISRWGVAVERVAGVRDDPLAVRKVLHEAAERCDAVLTTGGASKGEEDHVLDALDALGKRHLWQLAVKPGRPMMMGQIGAVPVIGLPGNPVAALVCALLYVRPILARLGGRDVRAPRRFAVPAAFDLRSKPDRREFLRGWTVGEGIDMRVEKFPRDGSGLVSGLLAASGLIEVPEEVTAIRTGDPVAFVPFAEFGLTD